LRGSAREQYDPRMPAAPDDILSMVFFARVVEAGSFTGAAAKLGVSKSSVSERISHLEERLRVRLLHRTTRKLALTQEGLVLFERCARVVAAADEAAVAAEGAGDTPRGLLRVNAPVVFAQEYLAAPMAAYLERYPHVRIELGMNDRLIDLVDEGVDVAVRITARLRGAGLIARKLASDRTVLCAAPAYLVRKGTPLSPQDLVHHDCLLYSLLKVTEEWRFRARGSKETFTVPIEGRFSAASGAMVRQAALTGMGLAVLPTFMVAADIAAGRLRPVVDTFQGVELGIFAVYPQARRPPGKVRAFVDTLVSHFRTRRWPAEKYRVPSPNHDRGGGRAP
jgi:DNA-binding transcriptional LysR family regulator